MRQKKKKIVFLLTMILKNNVNFCMEFEFYAVCTTELLSMRNTFDDTHVY